VSREHVPTVEVRIKQVRVENPDVRTFVLEPADPRETTLPYRAGQFLTFFLPVESEKQVVRTYSVSTCPVTDDDLAVTVKRERGGKGSGWFFDVAEPGTTLRAYRPAGDFTLTDSGDVVLFAAGVGITPVYSLCKNALAAGRSTYLHYSVSRRDDAVFADRLEQLRSRHERLALDVRETKVEGRLDREAVRTIGRRHAGATAYVCGPSEYTTLVVDGLLDAGWPVAAIKTESFGPPPETRSVAEPTAVAASKAVATAVVRVDGQDNTVSWPEDTPLIHVLDAAGIDVPSSCRQGECLTCECRVLKGRTTMRKNNVLDEDDLEAGYALACQLLPKESEVVVSFDE
jgi:3-ketosteroid 9alpha-monooxygenase subunit B